MTTQNNEFEILKTISVLYVEDEEDISFQLSLFLKEMVGVVYSAFDGQEGLEIYKNFKPDVVITDIRMPVMDGLEMAKYIRKIDQNTPIIITTAFDEQNYFLRSIDLGIDKFILKPIDPYLLRSELINVSKMKFGELKLNRSEKLVSRLSEENKRLNNENKQLSKGHVNKSNGKVADNKYKLFCGIMAHSLKSEFMHISMSIKSICGLTEISSELQEECDMIERSVEYNMIKPLK